MSSKKKTNEIQANYLRQHGKPMTRRQFLASGTLPFAASMTLPPLLAVLARAGVAEAADLCVKGGALDFPALITLNLSGGAGLSGNFIPHDAGLQPLASYSKVGMGKGGGSIPIDREFGNVPFLGNGLGKLVVGIRSVAQPTTLARTAFVAICVRSQDDSNINKFDITGMASKAGIAGSMLPNLGRSQTDTGTKNTFAFVKPPTPLAVGSYNDIEGALGVADRLGNLSNSQKSGLFRMVSNLSASQARRIASVSGGQTLGQLVKCAANDNADLIAKPSASTSPLQLPEAQRIWGINNNSNMNGQDFVFAAMVYNGVKGNAGTINLEIGGYDYHGNPRTATDQKDMDAGVTIGRILETFAALGRKGYLVVTSDGAVGSVETDQAGSQWTGDRGSGGLAFMIAFDPVARPQTKSFQLGQFTQAQAADDQFITGNVPELAAGAMFVNYLSFAKKMQLVDGVIPRAFTAADLEKVTMIA